MKTIKENLVPIIAVVIVTIAIFIIYSPLL